MHPPRVLLINKQALLAWTSAILACVLLLSAVRYCPSYENYKLTLFGAWVHTFLTDLSTQISEHAAAQNHPFRRE